MIHTPSLAISTRCEQIGEARRVRLDDHRSTLAALTVGRFDPTAGWRDDGWWRSTHTPAGPGTIHLADSPRGVTAAAYGPGADWLLERWPDLLGASDRPAPTWTSHPVVDRARRLVALPRFGRTHTPVHDLMPVVLAQRVTAREAAQQWRRLCRALGEPAPGPRRDLWLPPTPERLVGHPSWWYHRLGIETSRAEALRTIGRHARRIEQRDCEDPIGGRRWLELLPGIGPWSTAHIAQISWGDPDAVIVGDYWLPHLVVRAFTGRARGDDEEMLDLLSPWPGERGRVVRLLAAAGHRVERRGPGRRIQGLEPW